MLKVHGPLHYHGIRIELCQFPGYQFYLLLVAGSINIYLFIFGILLCIQIR